MTDFQKLQQIEIILDVNELIPFVDPQ